MTGEMDRTSAATAATASVKISVAKRVLTYIPTKFANQDLGRWRNRLTHILFVISVLKLGLFVPIVTSLMMAFGILLFEPNFVAAGFFAATAVWYIVLGLAIPIAFRILCFLNEDDGRFKQWSLKLWLFMCLQYPLQIIGTLQGWAITKSSSKVEIWPPLPNGIMFNFADAIVLIGFGIWLTFYHRKTASPGCKLGFHFLLSLTLVWNMRIFPIHWWLEISKW